MHPSTRRVATVLTLGLALFPAMFGAARALAAPTPAPNLVQLAQALLNAFNNADVATVRTLVAPGTHFIDDPGTSFALTQTLGDWLDEARSGATHANVNQITQTGANTVDLDVTVTGSAIPPLPHPYTGRITLTAGNGMIIGFLFITSDRTRQDLAALPPPGMPATGAMDTTSLAGGLALGLLCLTLGLGARRAARIFA